MPARHGLVNVTPGEGGISRKGAGTGFTYKGANGKRITDEDTLERIRGLVIPPAWKQVWIASEHNAHIQATGIDEAGRTQYLYHPAWREERDEAKFEKSLAFGAELPSLRRAVTRDLKPGKTEGDGPRRRALAAAVRLMDKGSLRVGGSEHSGQLEAFGATTLQRRHVEVEGPNVHLTFRGKSQSEWDIVIKDQALADFFSEAPKNPRSAPAVCYPIQEGRRRTWQGISAADVNAPLGMSAEVARSTTVAAQPARRAKPSNPLMGMAPQADRGGSGASRATIFSSAACRRRQAPR